MRLSSVEHQDRAISIVRRAMRSGRTHHAYLFEGPEGVGKELAARALAARLLCEAQDVEPDADACGGCRGCRLFAAGNHPDFHLIHRGLHKSHPERTIRAARGLFLVVDLVRHFLIVPSANTPSLGRRRVFLIRDAERMNDQAQNALLKTLEEPPGAACLVLVSSSAARLLPTIRSRCQRVPFDLLPDDFVAERLSALAGLAEHEARTLAGLAQGRLGAALRWQRSGLLTALDAASTCLLEMTAADPESFGKSVVEIATSLAERTIEATRAESTRPEDAIDEGSGGDKSGSSAGSLPTDELRDALKLVLLLVASCYRDALLVQAGAPGRVRTLPGGHALVDHLARRAPADKLLERIQAVADAERMLDRNVQPQLTCERLAVALSGAIPA